MAPVRVHPRDPHLHQDHLAVEKLTIRHPAVDPVSGSVVKDLDRDSEDLCLALLEILGDRPFRGSLFRGHPWSWIIRSVRLVVDIMRVSVKLVVVDVFSVANWATKGEFVPFQQRSFFSCQNPEF